MINYQNISNKANSNRSTLIKYLQLLFAYLILGCLYILNDVRLIYLVLFLILISFTCFIVCEKANLKFISIIFIVVLFASSISVIVINRESSKNEHKINQTINLNSNSENFNIFFIESNKERVELTTKQMCSIESAGLNNPNANIYLYSINAQFKNQILFKAYPNIKILKLIPEEIFSNTILFNWWNKKESEIHKGPNSIQDISDSIRIALLWKYGGLYSDLDTITIASFNRIVPIAGLGFIVESKNPALANGILNFPRGHKLLEEAMLDLSNNYNPNVWGYNGPRLFMRSIEKYCNLKDFYAKLILTEGKNQSGLLAKESKCDVSIFPENFFYPINWWFVNSLFAKESSLNIKQFMQTYSIHFYGKFSENHPVQIGDNSIYEFFASRNCPLTYEYIKLNNINQF